jgi:hypothetical protein
MTILWQTPIVKPRVKLPDPEDSIGIWIGLFDDED